LGKNANAPRKEIASALGNTIVDENGGAGSGVRVEIVGDAVGWSVDGLVQYALVSETLTQSQLA